jgi:DNA-binding transcriptional MerR regulator
MKTVFTSREASAITGLSHRQLAYWHKSGMISPSHQTPGGHARYSFTDLVALKTAKRLLDSGVSVQKMRKSIASLLEFLPQYPQPLAELSLLASEDMVLAFHQGAAFETISGQAWILPVAEMLREIERLRHGVDADAPQQQELFPPEHAWRPATDTGQRTGTHSQRGGTSI